MENHEWQILPNPRLKDVPVSSWKHRVNHKNLEVIYPKGNTILTNSFILHWYNYFLLHNYKCGWFHSNFDFLGNRNMKPGTAKTGNTPCNKYN